MIPRIKKRECPIEEKFSNHEHRGFLALGEGLKNREYPTVEERVLIDLGVHRRFYLSFNNLNN